MTITKRVTFIAKEGCEEKSLPNSISFDTQKNWELTV